MQPTNNEPGAGLSPILTVEETARFLRLGRTVTYEAVRTGVIPSVRVGHQYRIVRDQLLAWLESGGLKNGAGANTPAGSWEAQGNEGKPTLLR